MYICVILIVYLSTVTFHFIEAREFRIAWMAPKEEYHNFSAASSVGGLKLALNMLQEKYPDHDYRVKWYDTKCKSKSALAAATDAKRNFDPDVFLGPPCSAGMRGVGQLASHWNIPVFGWVSADIEFRDKKTYSTLVRLLGPLNRISSTMKFVSSMFRWQRFAMIHDHMSTYKAVAEAIRSEPEVGNYTITSTHEVSTAMSDFDVEEIFTQVRKYARVIIFAVPWHTLRKYMLVAHGLGMADGDFAFICIHSDLYTWDVLEKEVLSDRGWMRNDSRDHHARKAFESVIHVTTAAVDKKNFETFENLTRSRAHSDSPMWELPNATRPDPYSPYLYDATLVWAILANEALADGHSARNGTELLRRAPSFYNRGLTGIIVLDGVGDRLLNFWMLDMQEDGQFKVFTEIIYNKTGVIALTGPDVKSTYGVRWVNGKTGSEHAPPDIPECGFEDEHCREDYTNTIVGAAAGSSTVFVIAIVVNVILRRYRRLQALQSGLWQVKFEEIDFVTAMLCGSVRSSFRNLARRRSSQKKMTKSVVTIFANGSIKTDPNDSLKESPEQFHRTYTIDPAAMFGSVAYVRGSLVSVKRISKNTLNQTKEVIQELNQLMELKHQNVCAFVGASIDPGRILLLWEYCSKGSLQDVIWNSNIKLDPMFMFALSQDVAKGLEFIHKSSVHYHGRLKSSNCVVDSRWTCKLTDFGIPRIRIPDKNSQAVFDENFEKLLWTAPETLRGDVLIDQQKADIYSLAIILKEVFTRSGPYTEYPFLTSYEVVAKVREPYFGSSPFRPMIAPILRKQAGLTSLVEECWHEDPLHRCSAARVIKTLNRVNPSKNLTVIDNMIAMLEKYANHLEELVAERTSELDAEKKKTENLLYRMLPQSVAEDLKLGKPIKAEQFDEATIYFSDIVGFTTICADSTPIQVVNLLNSLYTLFDDIITRYDVYKVETIGDAYMMVSGLPKRNGSCHIKEIADCALDILASISTFYIPHQPEKNLRIRIGIHTGPVVAGVVGLAMPRYCLFGDTVNVSSRMESTGLPLKIHLSTIAKEKLEKFTGYHFVSRGEINVKGKGLMKTFFLSGKDGFTKELPKIDENSVHSDNASLTSPPSDTSSWFFHHRKESENSQSSLSSQDSQTLDNGASKFRRPSADRIKKTSIIEITSL